jgi:lysozyme family protein/phage protein D
VRLIAPYCRARIGDDIFETGDQILLEVSVDLGEDSRSSKCQFSVYDPGLIIGGKYQDISFKKGGIEVPPELLSSPNQQATPTTTSPNATLPTPIGDGGAAILSRPTGRNKAAQADYYSRVWASMTINPARAGAVREAAEKAISNQARYQSISVKTGVPWYVVAAIHYRECTYNFSQNIANGDSLQRRTVRVPAGRIPGVAPPYTFEQAAIDALTSDKRFKGVNWGSIPDLCWFLESYNGLGYLMKGRPSPYLLSGSQHYQSGKYVADGRYNASVVDQQLGTLPIIWYIQNSKRTMVPQTQPLPQQAQVQNITPPQEVAVKGTEIIIELGFEPSQLIAYHFIHTSTDSQKGDRDITTFTGQSVRWLLTRRLENKSFENITLRQLAGLVCKKHNLQLVMEGSGPTYQYLDQTGITTYELLLRQCRSIGYQIKDEANKLIIKPWGRPEFTGIVIDWENIIDLKFSDKARSDRTPTTGGSITSSDTPSADAKTTIDRQTGKTEQQKPDDKSGTGKGTTTPTGTSAPPIVGNVKSRPANVKSALPQGGEPQPKPEKPSSETKTSKRADGSTVVTTTTTTKTIERGKVVAKVETTIQKTKNSITSTIKKVVVTTETPKGTEIVTENIDENGVLSKKTTSNSRVTKAALDSLKIQEDSAPTVATANPGTPSDTTTGLPRQPVGAIDLADGRAEAITLQDEQRRIKGYEARATVVTTPEMLTLVPGSIIGISGKLVPTPFDREWRVSSVGHKFPGGVTTINFYTPQAAAQENAIAPVQNAPPKSATVTPDIPPTSGGWILPCSGRIGDGYGPRAGRPPGYRHRILDIAAPGGTPVAAMNDGVVAEVVGHCRVGDKRCGGGWGNYVLLQHAGGIFTRYCHLSAAVVSKGQQVKRGQVVGRVGNTGFSFGDHLHLDIRRGSGMGTAVLCSDLGLKVPEPHRTGFKY